MSNAEAIRLILRDLDIIMVCAAATAQEAVTPEVLSALARSCARLRRAHEVLSANSLTDLQKQPTLSNNTI